MEALSGSYPENCFRFLLIRRNPTLQQLVQSYLLKDIRAYEGIKQSDKIVKLLGLIGYKCGSHVSYTELATKVYGYD